MATYAALHLPHVVQEVEDEVIDVGKAIANFVKNISPDETTLVILDIVKLIGPIEPIMKVILAKDQTAQDIFQLVDASGLLTPPDFGSRPLTPAEREGWLKACARNLAKKELAAQIGKATLEIAGEVVSSVTMIPDSYIDAAIQIFYTVALKAVSPTPAPTPSPVLPPH